MLNSVCAPEMSSNSGDEDEPHAYVYYQGGQCEIVPISFIYNFPKHWRKPTRDGGGWDKNYLYKVFWSPDDDDTPSEMLKRVAEIPVYEKGASTEKPGYYRASVERVKGTNFTC